MARRTVLTSPPLVGPVFHSVIRGGPDSPRDGMLHMMCKLGQCAQEDWRRLRGFYDLAKVIPEVKFKDGIEASKVDQAAV